MTDEATRFTTLTAGDNRLVLDRAVGHLRALTLSWGGRQIAPLHTAPWVGTAQADLPGLPPVDRNLSGDFLCAPFGATDAPGIPPHGWPANAAWHDLGGGHFALSRDVQGARVTKRLRLASGAPFLYQEHLIDGGTGGLTVAHHPMVRLAGRGRLTHAPIRRALTTAPPLEPGRHVLRYPAEATDSARFPGLAGDVDLGALPLGAGHEDFVTLVAAAGTGLGWTAILREAEDDIVLFLKAPDSLPVTMLWYSNGGRDHAPWSGRHRGVIGVEDGCTAGALGAAAALGDTPIRATGVPTALKLAEGRTHRIAHVIGALPRPAGWRAVTEVAATAGTLTLTDTTGETLTLPFDDAFLSRPA